MSSNKNVTLLPDELTALDNLPFREPVLPDPSFDHLQDPAERSAARDASYQERIDAETSVERAWGATSEAMRRAIIGNPLARQAIQAIMTVPLSEQLPALAVSTIAPVDAQTQRLANTQCLQNFLNLPAVDDGALEPSLRKAPYLYTKEDAIQSIEDDRNYGNGELPLLPEDIHQLLLERPGITRAEHDLVATRYRLARDTKLLALAAEVIDVLPPPELSERALTYNLPSGTKLVLDKDECAANPELLQPILWTTRKQLKDRVYELTIGGKPFIMKERKTKRHTDTPKNKHFDGLTSQEEFETAQHFASLGTIKKDGIELRWEKPVGYVEFPDGYQFCIFEFETLLTSKEKFASSESVMAQIIAERYLYEDEYQLVKQRAEAIYTSDYPPLSPRAFTKTPELSFEEYANVKAQKLVLDVSSLVNEIITSQGYIERDGSEEVAHASSKPGTLIEAVAFDLEYCFRAPEAAHNYAVSRAAHKAKGSNVFRRPHGKDDRMRRMREATDLALRELDGWYIPID